MLVQVPHVDYVISLFETWRLVALIRLVLHLIPLPSCSAILEPQRRVIQSLRMSLTNLLREAGADSLETLNSEEEKHCGGPAAIRP